MHSPGVKKKGYNSQWLNDYTFELFGDNKTPYGTESVHFFLLMSAAT